MKINNTVAKHIKKYCYIVGLLSFLLAFFACSQMIRYQEKEKIHEAIYNADAEMWQNGIVAVGDICNTTDTISAKLQSPIQYQNFIEAYSFIPEKVKDDFQKLLDSVVDEIFDPETDFYQTSHELSCVYCTFKNLCNR